jgi:uncharacterized protein (DUF305 family)
MLRTHRRFAVAVVALAFSLTGCSNPHAGASAPAPAPAPARPPFNETDAAFAAQLVSQHQQGLDLASLANSRSGRGELKALAQRFIDVHEPEIEQLSELLESWGQQPPEDPGLDRGNRPGKITEAEMNTVTSRSGADFDKLFVQLMIRHHQGAIDIVATETAGGKNPRARELADKIGVSQQNEVTELKNVGGV